MTGTPTLVDMWARTRVVDLTHTLQEGIPQWPSDPPLSIERWNTYSEDGSTANRLTLGEHIGTHCDAPVHFVPGGARVDEVDLSRFMGRALRIDAASALRGGQVDAEAVQRWERAHTAIRADDLVLFDFGWATRWGTGESGAAFLSPWPGLSVQAADYLVERRVSAVGTDTASIDPARADGYPAHRALLGAGVVILESLARLAELPDRCLVVAVPLKVWGGSGSPVRAFALVEE